MDFALRLQLAQGSRYPLAVFAGQAAESRRPIVLDRQAADVPTGPQVARHACRGQRAKQCLPQRAGGHGRFQHHELPRHLRQPRGDRRAKVRVSGRRYVPKQRRSGGPGVARQDTGAEHAGPAALDQGQRGQPAAFVSHDQCLKTGGGGKVRQPIGNWLGPSQRRRTIAALPKIVPGRCGSPKLGDRVEINYLRHSCAWFDHTLRHGFRASRPRAKLAQVLSQSGPDLLLLRPRQVAVGNDDLYKDNA